MRQHGLRQTNVIRRWAPPGVWTGLMGYSQSRLMGYSPGALERRCPVPWTQASAMEMRTRFIEDYQRHRFRFSELCRRYGVSRKIGYKWV